MDSFVNNELKLVQLANQTQDWQLMAIAVKVGPDYFTGTHTDQLAAYKYTVVELAAIGNIECDACQGFGHCKKDCPTNKKLTSLGGNGSRAGRVVSTLRSIVRCRVRRPIAVRSSISKGLRVQKKKAVKAPVPK